MIILLYIKFIGSIRKQLTTLATWVMYIKMFILIFLFFKHFKLINEID